MAGLIPKAFIDDLIGRADIVEIINARVPLKKAGREYRACCPFHNEKTPSFWVNPVKQFYHCFGCGAHGTVLSFLMNYDHLPFVEAVEDLASRMGVEVPREAGSGPSAPTVSDDLYAVMGKVATFYAEQLASTERARSYAAKRGMTPDIIARFGIGYAPDSWNEVLKRFGASNESRQKLIETGLIITRDSGEGHYDRFRDRLMFPIRDSRGRVIAFGGRILDQGEPKYLNSPETALFHKGRELYGLYEVRQSRAPLTRLIVVEGYMDVVRLHQSGIGYAAATLGTATTPEHLKRAFRLVKEIIFCFDGDRAGRAAAWRALQNALPEAKAGHELKFLFLPDGEDPDTLVGKEGQVAFEARYATAKPLSEYLVERLKGDTNDPVDGKARFIAEALPLLERVPMGPYRDLIRDRMAKAIAVKPELFTTADTNPSQPELRHSVAARSAGRGGLVRQAVQNLLHFPEVAAKVSAVERRGLEAVTEPGIDVLRELLDTLQLQPATHTGQLLERWRDQPLGERLARLAAESSLLADEKAAADELVTAVRELVRATSEIELNVLIAKEQNGWLSDAERLRLVELLKQSRRN